MGDVLEEVYLAMCNNKMRIALTGFSIGWGMFILIVLLGSGNGLLGGMRNNFGAQSDNVVTLQPGTTSVAACGMPDGRPIHIDQYDVDALKKEFGGQFEQILPYISRQVLAIYGQDNTKTELVGTSCHYMYRNEIRIFRGRDINELDQVNGRKVCVISEKLRGIICERDSDCIGKCVTIDSVPFRIVGIYKPIRAYNTTTTIYIPLSTMKNVFKTDGYYSSVMIKVVGIESTEANDSMLQHLQTFLAQRKQYSASDKSGIWISNDYDNFMQISGFFSVIGYFMWIVGLATLIAGVVGICNIMLIAVKERTRELGIRKAMGASNRSIITLVLTEAVIITLIFGYVGMMIGLALTQLGAMALGSDNEMFCNPTVSLGVVISCNMVMVIAGIIAGYIPAKHAVTIKLVDALMG